MAEDIGKLLLSIGLDVSGLRQGLNRADDDIKKFSKQAKQAFKFFGAGVAFNFLGNLDEKLKKSADSYQKIGLVTTESIKGFHQLVSEGENLKRSFEGLIINIAAVIQPLAGGLIAAAKEFFNYVSQGYKLIGELATKGVTTPDQPGFIATDRAPEILGRLGLRNSAIASGIGKTKSIGDGSSRLSSAAIDAASSLTKFKDSLEKTGGVINNMVDGILKSNKASKTADELGRILEDRLKNPWELTKEQIAANARRDELYKQSGFSEQDIAKMRTNSRLYDTGQRPDTSQFDSTLLKAFDLIQQNATANKDQINALLKSADKLAQGIGQFGAVDELRKAQQQRLEGADKAMKLTVEVLASKDFEIRIASSQAIQAAIKNGVYNAIVNEAGLAASGAIQ